MMFLLTARLLATLSAMLALSPTGMAQAVSPPESGIEQAAEPSLRASFLAQPTIDGQDHPRSRVADPMPQGWSNKMVRPCVRTGNRVVC